MDRTKMLDWIGSNPFFQFMNEEEKESLCVMDDCWSTFAPGDFILKVGEVDYGFFVMVQGKASVLKPDDIFLAQLFPGDVFGEISLKPGKRTRHSHVVADDDVVVFKVNRELLDKLGSTLQLKVKDQIINLMTHRLDGINQKLQQLTRAR